MKALYRNNFFAFLVLHFCVWVGIPGFRKSIPLDSIEAIMWGRYCDLGTNKHPPLSGFLAEWFYELFGCHNLGIYFLSQLCVLLGFIYLYKLAKCFLEDGKAVLSVMLLEGVIYYGFSAQEFNVNVVSLALWPMCAYYFYTALQKNSLSAWVLTGVFAGLNIFNKYTGGMQLFCMAALLLCTAFGRQQFKKVGPYVTFLVFLSVIAPHIWWLYQHDFYSFIYIMERSAGENESILWEASEHIIYPLKFLITQVLFGLLVVVIYFLNYRRGEKETSKLSLEKKQFLKYMGILPVLVFAAIAMIEGIRLKSMWGFPTLYMLSILLFAFYPFKLNDKVFRRMRKMVYIVMFLFGAAAITIIFCDKSEKINFPNQQFANDMSQTWAKHNKSEFKYVWGEIWYIANVSLYAKENPKPVAGIELEHSPWLDADDVVKSGALVIYLELEKFERLRLIYKNLQGPYEYKLEIKNRIGKVKNKTIYYGFISPATEVKND